MSYSGRNTNRSLAYSGPTAYQVGAQSSLPPRAYSHRPSQDSSRDPLQVCEIHVYNSNSSRWLCIWKQQRKDPLLGVLLSADQPQVLKFVVGHTSAGVHINFQDVSIVECKYLPVRKESEMQLRIWKPGVSPEWLKSGAGGLVNMGRTIFNKFNRAVDDGVRLMGVADILLIGPEQHMEQHVRALDITMWKRRIDERRVEEGNELRVHTSTSSNQPLAQQANIARSQVQETPRAEIRQSNHASSNVAAGVHTRFSSPEDTFSGRMLSDAPSRNQEIQQDSERRFGERRTDLDLTPQGIRRPRNNYNLPLERRGGANGIHGLGNNQNFQPGKGDSKGSHVPESGQNPQPEKWNSQRQNPGGRLSRKNQSNETDKKAQAALEQSPESIKKESEVEEDWRPQQPEEKWSGRAPVGRPHATYDCFCSRCGTCGQWFESGRSRHQHAIKTKHPITCNICIDPVPCRVVYDLLVHYKRTGHIDKANDEPSVIDTRKRKRDNEDMAESQEGAQDAKANHTRLENERTNGRTQVSAIDDFALESSLAHRALPKPQTIDLDDELPPNSNGKRKRHKEKQQETSEDDSGSTEGGRQRKQGKKQKKKRQQRQKPQAETSTLSSSSPTPSSSSPSSSSSSPLPLISPPPQEKEKKKKKRKKGTEGQKKKESSTPTARSKKQRQKSWDGSRNRSRRRSLSLSSQFSSSPLFSSGPSGSSSPTISHSISRLADNKQQQEEDQRRLQEFAARRAELALKQHELKVQRDKLKFEEEQLRLEIRRRQLAEAVGASMNTRPASPGNVEADVRLERGKRRRSSAGGAGSRGGASGGGGGTERVGTAGRGDSSALRSVGNFVCSACGTMGHRKNHKTCPMHPDYVEFELNSR